jgi:mRNA-degrading endonuclease YafQ of YafQ-DinJ toxin-antitoxin module
MIHITYSNGFRKSYLRLPNFIQDKFKERLKLFIVSPNHILLKKHRLHGIYENFFSINVTGDYRAIFKQISDSMVEFRNIGTHSQLYK